MTDEHFTKAVSWDAWLSCLDPLIKEGHIIIIEKSSQLDYEGEPFKYLVKVVYKTEVVAHAHAHYLTDAMADAYGSTPERKTGNG